LFWLGLALVTGIQASSGYASLPPANVPALSIRVRARYVHSWYTCALITVRNIGSTPISFLTNDGGSPAVTWEDLQPRSCWCEDLEREVIKKASHDFRFSLSAGDSVCLSYPFFVCSLRLHLFSDYPGSAEPLPIRSDTLRMPTGAPVVPLTTEEITKRLLDALPGVRLLEISAQESSPSFGPVRRVCYAASDQKPHVILVDALDGTIKPEAASAPENDTGR
jgi:hypothetical protein